MKTLLGSAGYHQLCGAAMTLTIPFMTYNHSEILGHYLQTSDKKNITVQIHTYHRHFIPVVDVLVAKVDMCIMGLWSAVVGYSIPAVTKFFSCCFGLWLVVFFPFRKYCSRAFAPMSFMLSCAYIWSQVYVVCVASILCGPLSCWDVPLIFR